MKTLSSALTVLVVILFAAPGWIVSFPVSCFILGVGGAWFDARRVVEENRNPFTGGELF